MSDSVKDVKGVHPSVKNCILAGSGVTLGDSCQVLKEIGVPEAEIIDPAINNPGRYVPPR